MLRRCRFEASVLLLVVFGVTGCTRAVDVPTSEWENVDEVTEGDYRIRTVDGRDYATGKFTKTDSTVVIFEVYRDGKRIAIDPVVLSLEEVDSVKKVQLWSTGTNIIVISTFVVAAGLAVALVFTYWMAKGVGGLN